MESILVVTGLSIAAGVLYSPYSEKNKEERLQNVDPLFLKVVSEFMRLSENLRLLIFWLLLPQETYICSQ